MRDGPTPDRALDRYQDAVASLHREGALVGHLATRVEGFRGSLSLRRQERVWLLLTWVDGRRERIQEDYPPWSYLPDLDEDRITWDWSEGAVTYEVRWLEGAERRDAWQRYGITEEIGAYL